MATIHQDERMRNKFTRFTGELLPFHGPSRKTGAFQLLQIMEGTKADAADFLCRDCGFSFEDNSSLLVDTGRGHYTNGPALCAYCKANRNAELSAEVGRER